MTTTADSPVTYGTPSDQAAIASLTQRVVAAWAYHDADTFANLFIEDGSMILMGTYAAGREDIRKFLVESFDGKYKGTQVTGKPLALRFLSPDVALLQTIGGVLEAGETEVSRTGAIRATWTAVRRDGQWMLAAYQNTPRHDLV